MKLETLESIWEVGRKYTIVKYSEMGFPHAIQFTAKAMTIEPWAQYPKIARLICLPKGKRNGIVIRLNPKSMFLLFDGWVKPDVNMYRDFDFANNGQVECKKTLLCFSPEYMEIARNSVKSELCLCANY